jgi:hypothetical protein
MTPPYDGTPHLRGLEIAAGLFSNVRPETKFGHALSLGNTRATIWSPIGIYAYPTVATTMTISSGSVDDVAGSDGISTARVIGQDADNVEVSRVMTMNGRNGVTIPIDLLRSYRIECLTSDDTADDAGNKGKIYVGSGALTDGVPANIFAQVDVGLNQTLMTPYTIPAGKKGWITHLYASLGGAKDLALEICVREPGEVFRAKRVDHVRSSVFSLPLDLPIGGSNADGSIPEKSDIEMRGTLDAASIDVAAAYDIVLIDM